MSFYENKWLENTIFITLFYLQKNSRNADGIWFFSPIDFSVKIEYCNSTKHKKNSRGDY